jgi:hypothetical protein
MSLKKLDEPVKVGKENNKQTRIDYFLNVFEGNQWETVGFEVLPNGTVRTKIKEVCDMPYDSQIE